MIGKPAVRHARLDQPGVPLRVALITDPEHPGLRPDDVGLTEAFASEGASARPIPWGDRVDPGAFDLAVIRTPWDYFLRPLPFMAWIGDLEIPVLNPERVLRWNHDKRYLFELDLGGYAKIPRTIRLEAGSRGGETAEILEELGTRRAVVKPVVSGGAHGTRVISLDSPLAWETWESGAYLAQAFVATVEQAGEWSLVYFGGVFSHAVLKKARPGDFRVQDDHGGTVHFEPVPEGLKVAGERVLSGLMRLLSLDQPLPYARVDLVEDSVTGGALLMELELIEPELFLRADALAPGRFARAVIDAALPRKA